MNDRCRMAGDDGVGRVNPANSKDVTTHIGLVRGYAVVSSFPLGAVPARLISTTSHDHGSEQRSRLLRV